MYWVSEGQFACRPPLRIEGGDLIDPLKPALPHPRSHTVITDDRASTRSLCTQYTVITLMLLKLIDFGY